MPVQINILIWPSQICMGTYMLYAYVCNCMCICIGMCVYMHVCVCINIYACIYVNIQLTHACMFMYGYM